MRISRRTMLAGSAAAVAGPLLAVAASRTRHAAAPSGERLAAAQTASTVSFSIQNNTGSDTVYAFVTGQAINNGSAPNDNALMLLEADGQSPSSPAPPAPAGSPLAVDCAIPLNPSGGSAVTITVPQLAGARVWFSIGT